MLLSRKYSGMLFAVACLVLVWAASSQAKSNVKRSAVIPIVSKGPVLKGDLSDPVWSKGVLLSNFTSLEKVTNPIQQTSVRALYDSNYLYLGVSCREANMSGLVARSRGRNANVWKDDSIEVVMDTSNAQHMFYHLFINPVGGNFGTKCVGSSGSSEEWQGGYKVKTAKRADGWSAEFAVPFSAMGITPTQGLVWGLNVCRNRVAGTQELSAWNPTPWGFGKPDYFGQVVFGDRSGKWNGIRLESWGDMGVLDVSATKNSVVCSVPNDRRTPVTFSAVLQKTSNGKSSKAIVKSIVVKPKNTGVLDIPYKLAGSDGGRWALSIKKTGVQVFKALRDVPAVSAPLRVWQLKDPLYEELLSNNPPGDQRNGSIYWLHTYQPTVLPNFGKEFGIRYSNEEAIKELSDAKLLAIRETSAFSDKYFMNMLDKYNVKVLFSPDIANWSAPDAPKVWNVSYILDPRSKEIYFADLKSSLAKYGKYIWGVYSGDELDNYVMHQTVILYSEHKNDYPYILEVNEQIKKDYGSGKYGIPESIRDTNPYRWIALRRWAVKQLTDWQMEVYRTVKDIDPNVRVISMDPPGSHRPVAMDRMSPYFDIATHQLYPPTDPNRQQFGFITKMVSDLTGKPTWPCVHVEHYAFSTTPEEVRELMSEVMRNGGKSFHFWLKDETGKNADNGYLMATKWGYPERWRAICEINTLNGKMNEVAVPTDPDFAIFYSEDHYSSFSEHFGIPNEPEWAYTFFGPDSRTWFSFVSDNMVEDGNIDLSRFKAVVIPGAKYERASIGDALREYVADGGTLVVGDPEAFSTDVNGEPLTSLRESLIGFPVSAGKDQDSMKFSADCSMPGLRNRSLATPGKAFVLKVGENTEVMAKFPDGTPAVIKNKVGTGSVIVFSVNPFTQSGISDQAWKDFFKAFATDLGVKTDRSIWRFKFPEFKTVTQVESDEVCLTGNHIKWWEDAPVYTRNAAVAGTYSYSVIPDATGDRGSAKIAFTAGKLTDRKSAYTTPTAKLNANNFVVTWKSAKPVDVTFDLLQPRDVSRVNFWYSGQLPNVKVLGSTDGKNWKEIAGCAKQVYVKPDGVSALEDVLDISMSVSGHPKVRYIKLSFAARDAGNPLTLAECEIWGNPAK